MPSKPLHQAVHRLHIYDEERVRTRKETRPTPRSLISRRTARPLPVQETFKEESETSSDESDLDDSLPEPLWGTRIMKRSGTFLSTAAREGVRTASARRPTETSLPSTVLSQSYIDQVLLSRVLSQSACRHFDQGLYYQLSDASGFGPPLLREVLESRGWSEFIESGPNASPYWNLCWRGTRFTIAEYQSCMSWQRINHFPKTAYMTRKDRLFRLLRKMKGIYGAQFDWFPMTFNLPNEYTKFVREHGKDIESGKKCIWLCKPPDLSRGRGIFLFRSLPELTYDNNTVLQRYIQNPLLIDGYKFDLRCYVVVTSFQPLVVYVYEEGLARFATDKYDDNSLDNIYSHLTNTSINKFGPHAHSQAQNTSKGAGCKWTMAQLRRYFESKQMDFDALWHRIQDILVLTCLSVAHEVPKNMPSCFELFGFDIIIDNNLKPWVLEVNFCPALTHDCDVDVTVKVPMLNDMISLLGLGEKDIKNAEQYSLSRNERNLRRATSLPALPTSSIMCADRVGQFTRVFPFNERTRTASKNIVIGSENFRLILSEIRNCKKRK